MQPRDLQPQQQQQQQQQDASNLSSSPASSPHLDFARFVSANPERFDTWSVFDDKDLRTGSNSTDETEDLLSPSEASATSSFLDDSTTEDQTTSPTTTTSSTSPLAYRDARLRADVADTAVVRRSSSIHRRYQDRRMRQGRLLLVSMLENFCALYDESPERNRRLFYVICKQLHHMGIIDADDFLDELSTVRGSYKRAFRDLVVRAMASIKDQDQQATLKLGPSTFGADGGGGMAPPPPPPPSSSSLIDQRAPFFGPASVSPLLPLRAAPATSHRNDHVRPTFSSVWDARSSRYAEDFVELEMLGKGAFGRVYRVRNRLDGIEYAIKKVRLRMGTSKLERLLREVKFQARLTHGNVVRYYSAWVEDIPDDRNGRGRPIAQLGAELDSTPPNVRAISPLRESPPDFCQPTWTHPGRITEVHTDASDDDAEESLGRVNNDFDEDVDIVFTDDQGDSTLAAHVTSEKGDKLPPLKVATKLDTAPEPGPKDTSKRRGSFFEKPSSDGDSDEESRAMDSGSESWEQPSTPQAVIPSTSLNTVVAEDTSSTSNSHPPPALKSSPERISSNTHPPPPPPPTRIPKHQLQDPLPSSLRLTLLIQMELCSHTLQDFLRERNERCFTPRPDGSLPNPAVDAHHAHTIFRDLAEGLLYVHSMGCIHRDIKPKNIYWKSTTTGYSHFSPANGSCPMPPPPPPSSPAIVFSPVSGAWKIGDFGLVTAADLNDGGESDGAASGVRRRQRRGDGDRQDTAVCGDAVDGVSDKETDEDRYGGRKGSERATKDSPHGSIGEYMTGDGGGDTPRRRLARSVTSCSDRTIGVGTVTYASPEQLHPSQSTPYSSASDIYSLGIVMFELLQPFQTGMERARALQDLRAGAAAAAVATTTTNAAAATPNGIMATTPDAAFQAAFPAETALIRRMMSQDPEQRPTAAELCAWCDDVLREHGTAVAAAVANGRPRTADGMAIMTPLSKCAPGGNDEPRQPLAAFAESPSADGQTTNPMTLVPPPDEQQHDDPLIEQNRALKVRVEELERRLQALGVSI
ncbi:Eukaryotic translation initiation factor 2-alpha kinase [Geranomyces michiganensis]|nr:Eukaryotic translation initiation factor 2-alpha kinase [Geranomyces michiganensis]